MAEEFKPGDWVRLRGTDHAGPVFRVDGPVVTFLDMRLSTEMVVPAIAISAVGSSAHAWPRPDRYEVSALPRHNLNRRLYTIYLEARPGDRWTVVDGYQPRQFLSAAGTWEFAGDGGDEWKAAHWHTFSDASRLAADAAEQMVTDLPDRFRHIPKEAADDA